MVPSLQDRTRPDRRSQGRSGNNGGERQGDATTSNTSAGNDKFGDLITTKNNKTLRISFQNIGGLPTWIGELDRRNINYSLEQDSGGNRLAYPLLVTKHYRVLRHISMVERRYLA